MRIYVADLWPKPQLEREIILSDTLDGLPLDTVLYVPVPRWTDVPFIDSQLYRLLPSLQRAADALVLRVHQTEAEVILSQPDVAEYLNLRFETGSKGIGRPIWMLHWSTEQHKHVLTRVLPDGTYRPESGSADSLTEPQVEQLIKSLRHAEMRTISYRSGALLPLEPNYHYSGPNSKHYQSFLRVGTALQSVDAMDGVSFWLIPHLSSNTLLLLESWTILSLGLNVEHYVDECNFADTLAVDTVECLHNYNEADEYRDTLLWRLARVRQHCAPDAAVLFVVSVASLGNLSRKVVETCRQVGFETVKVVSLFSSESYRAHLFEEVFCQLNEHFEPHSAEDCPECNRGSTAVRINPSTYLLEISATVVPTEIKMLDAQEPEVRDFFGRYKGHNCIWVHRDRHDGARHHMIYVDVQALMRVPEFQKRLANTVEQIRNHVNVVIAPRHPAATELAERVAAQLGVSLINREETELENLPADMKEVLNSGKILIVDDVVITGTRLRGYRNGLQRFGYIEDATEVRCLVGVARPQNEGALRGITDLVHRARNFTFVEKVFLPDWQEEKCPWCWELRQLDRQDVNEALSAVTDLTLMKERRERLFRTADGMQGDIFLHWSSANVPSFWNLGPQSIFASESQVDLFAEIASILQRFRNSGRLDEQFSPPVAKIYEPEYVLTGSTLQPETSIGGRYYAPVIVAAILRATQRHDLRSASREQALMRAVTSRIEESVSSELRSEIMFAAANGRLPRVASMRDSAGEIYQGEPGVCEFLRHLLAENYETSVQDVTDATF